MAERRLDRLSVELSKSCDLSAWISSKLNETTIIASLRNRVVASCFAVTLDHSDAVLALLGRSPKIYSTAFALMRLVFESCTRGLWLMYCATELEIEKFSNGNLELPKMKKIIEAVEGAVNFDAKLLSTAHTSEWNHLCDYTHTGTLQVQRWNKIDSIEPSYSDEEVIEVIRFTRAYSLLAAVSFAEAIIGDSELAKEFLSFYNETSMTAHSPQ
jgi:hypothetical protein